MNRTRTAAAVAVIVGVVFISMGYRSHPQHMLSVVTGVLFVIAGIFRFLRVRTS
jgi:drug/metabolite transporter (DMT)-like permease